MYGSIQVYHVTRLKLFIGSRNKEEAYELAKKDADQFEVECILLAKKGNPEALHL